ncbi:MAG: hypothetical protein ACTSQJ_01125 [Promethearchaeota archaeon]
MKKIRNYKKILIIFLIAFPTMLFFGFMSTNVQAKTRVGINYKIDKKNEWYWDFDEGNIIMFEHEIRLVNQSQPNQVITFKQILIYNITTIKNVTMNFLSLGQQVSIVNGTEYYYNLTTSKIEPVTQKENTLGVFGSNSTDLITEKMRPCELGLTPWILPKNSTSGLDTTLLAHILNESFYTPLGKMYGLPHFNVIQSSTPEKWLYFANTTTGYYFNMSYFENGTMKEGSAFLPFYGGPNTIWNMTAITKRVFDPYIWDEITWDVKPGDVFYYGDNSYELKYDIKGFNLTYINIPYLFGYQYQIFMVLIGNISLWNRTTEKYDLMLENKALTYANNFYPMLPLIANVTNQEGGTIIFPNSTTNEDLAFIFNNESVGQYFGMEEITFSDGKIVMNNYTSGEMFEIVWNTKTGLIDLLYQFSGFPFNPNKTMVSFRKNTSVITDPTHDFNLYSRLIKNWKASINASLLVPNCDLYWATLPVNPLLRYAPFKQELPGLPVYLDLYANNSLGIFSLNLTISYNETLLNMLGIPEEALAPFSAEVKDSKSNIYEWSEAPSNIYTLDTVNNKIIVYFPGIDPNTTIYSIGIGKMWNWGVSENESIMIESHAILTNTSNGKTYVYDEKTIYEIDKLATQTVFWNGSLTEFNIINFTLMYYDPSVKKRVPFQFNPVIPLCGFNDTKVLKYYMSEMAGGVPFVLPLQYGKLNMTIARDMLMKSFYNTNMSRQMGIPNWNIANVDEITNTLDLSNTSLGYYMNLRYYENGTIASANIYSTFKMGNSLFITNYTSSRTFNCNTTSNIDWNVKVGDKLYYGDAHGEFMYEITKINESAVNLYSIELAPYTSWQTFSNVWANVYYWNGSAWILYNKTIIGAANNYYAIGPGSYNDYFNVSETGPSVVLPAGIDAYAFANNIRPYLRYIGMETVIAYSADYLRFENSTLGEYWDWYINPSTGVLELLSGRTWDWYHMRWDYYTIFLKNPFYLPIGAGTSIITLINRFIPDFSGFINVTKGITGTQKLVLHSFMDINPTNVSLPGQDLVFFDLMIESYGYLSNNISITLFLPPSYDLSIMNLQFWKWNMYNNTWELMKKSIIIGTNSIKISFNIGPIADIFGISYTLESIPGDDDDDDDDDSSSEEEIPELEIPGYSLLILLFSICVISAISIKKQKKR